MTVLQNLKRIFGKRLEYLQNGVVNSFQKTFAISFKEKKNQGYKINKTLDIIPKRSTINSFQKISKSENKRKIYCLLKGQNGLDTLNQYLVPIQKMRELSKYE